MEHVEGVRLDEYWFKGTGSAAGGGGGEDAVVVYSADQIQLRRRRILEGLARAMLRLSACEMSQGGALVVNEADWRALPHAAAPARHLDVQAMLGRWGAHDDGGFSENCDYDDDGDGDGDDCDNGGGDDKVREDRGGGRGRGCGDGIERTPLYIALWPHSDPRDAYTALLDRYPPETEAAASVHALLRLLLKMVREPPPSSKNRRGGNHHSADGGGEEGGEKTTVAMPFVLAHPDLQLRHVIVCEETGEIRGLVGWDGARAVPKSMGNEALPRWLVRDFNPFTYSWVPDAASVGVGGGGQPDQQQRQQQAGEGGRRWERTMQPEDPPWVLAELRGMYADIMEGLKRKRRIKAAGVKLGGSAGDLRRETNAHGVDVTRQSLLAIALDEAVKDPRCRRAVLQRVLQKCSRQFEMIDYEYIVDVLGSGDRLDKYTLKCLRRNVKELIKKGFVRGAIIW